jgi:hypothetical protein
MCECNTVFEETGFGLDICRQCGVARPGSFFDPLAFLNHDKIVNPVLYTRQKRFKKYLSRTNRSQSANTIPEETWEYLFERKPFRDAREIHTCLKKAKHLKRKCYDSLPFLCSHLCTVQVPVLESAQCAQAMRLFETIDYNLKGQSMISYLFCLEFILEKIDRVDMIPFVNRIKCPKRRSRYRKQLESMFGDKPTDIRLLLHPETLHRQIFR